MKTIIVFLLSIHFLNAQWTKVDLPNTSTAQSLFVDGNTLYVGGDNKIFYKTDGEEWNESSTIGELYEGVTALLKVNNRIFAGSFTHGVYESTNNGISWIHRTNGLPASAQVVEELVVRGNYLYAATLGEGVYEYDLNNTNQWSEYRNGLEFGVAWTIYSLYNHNDTLIAGAGANASVHINFPGSTMWNNFPVDIFNGDANSMLAITEHNGVLHTAASYAVYRSTNGGVSWEKFNPGVGLISQAAYAKNGNSLYVNLAKVGRNFIYSTTDNGVTWNLFNDVISQSSCDVEIFNNRIYSALYDGLWYYPLSPTDVKPGEPIIPDKIILEQNYPNPFNPVTKIKFTIPTSPQSPPSKGGEAKQGWFTTLKVYDVLGNEVATLVNEYKPAGNYEIEFSTNILASGVYIYRLDVGGIIKSKKMIFMK